MPFHWSVLSSLEPGFRRLDHERLPRSGACVERLRRARKLAFGSVELRKRGHRESVIVKAMLAFGPPWKLGLTGAVAVFAGVALLLVNWQLPQLAAFVAMLFVGRGALHVVTTSFAGVTGALSALQGGGETGVGVLLLVWPHPTLLVVAVVVGTWVVVRATVEATLTLATRGDRPRWPVSLGVDLVELALGVALIARPADTVHAAALTLGAIAILAGAIEIVTAVARMRHHPRPAVVEVGATAIGV